MRSRRLLGLLLGCTLTLAIASAESSAQQKAAKANKAATSAAAKEETGSAVFYSDKLVGRPLTSGEKYDKNALTAAHRTLPLGTMVKVTNLKNSKSVVVRINDRGPHGPKTDIIDLSGRAAQDLDMIKDGRAKVKLEVVEAAKK
jgi:peptidoglycan lytic transglycosylase